MAKCNTCLFGHTTNCLSTRKEKGRSLIYTIEPLSHRALTSRSPTVRVTADSEARLRQPPLCTNTITQHIVLSETNAKAQKPKPRMRSQPNHEYYANQCITHHSRGGRTIAAPEFPLQVIVGNCALARACSTDKKRMSHSAPHPTQSRLKQPLVFRAQR